MRTFMIAGVSAAALLALSACNSEEPADTAAMTADPAMEQEAMPAESGTVVEVAQGNPEFSTLVEAVTAADLAGTLNGAGPFTVFAPTNAAFEKIPAEERDALTQPEGQAELRRLLTYHVIPARLEAAALVQRIQAAGGSLPLTTMQGGTLTARTDAGGSITLTDATGGTARVVESDGVASNGVIHTIDTVAAPG